MFAKRMANDLFVPSRQFRNSYSKIFEFSFIVLGSNKTFKKLAFSKALIL